MSESGDCTGQGLGTKKGVFLFVRRLAGAGREEKRGKRGGMPEPEEEEEQETLTADVYQKAKGWSLCDAAATHLGLRAVMQNY